MIDEYTPQQFQVRLKLRGILITKKEREQYLRLNSKNIYTETDFIAAYHWREYVRYNHRPTRSRTNTRASDGQNMASMGNDGKYKKETIKNE